MELSLKLRLKPIHMKIISYLKLIQSYLVIYYIQLITFISKKLFILGKIHYSDDSQTAKKKFLDFFNYYRRSTQFLSDENIKLLTQIGQLQARLKTFNADFNRLVLESSSEKIIWNYITLPNIFWGLMVINIVFIILIHGKNFGLF